MHANERVVYVKFLDHVIFKDSSAIAKPIIRETIGWLIREDKSFITLLWVREDNCSPQLRRATGITILKSDIIEVREVRLT